MFIILLYLKGDTVASCDADGVLKLWDVRMVMECGSIQANEHSLNGCSFDRSGDVVAAASNDGTVRPESFLPLFINSTLTSLWLWTSFFMCFSQVKIFSTREKSVLAELRGHDDAVQSVLFDPSGQSLYSAGSDSSFLVWK